jgi:hypothetical protein
MMSAIKGDWYASRSTHDGESYPQGDDTVRFVYATQADGTKFIVAKVWSGDDGDYAGTAKLVAAAPELLYQLKQAVALIVEKDLFDWEDAPSGNSFQDMEDAIRRAEGRD